MNKQIREIEFQAWEQVKRTNGLVRTDDFNQKFAELIVKECAEIADNADATREKWQSIGKFVKEHFGVE